MDIPWYVPLFFIIIISINSFLMFCPRVSLLTTRRPSREVLLNIGTLQAGFFIHKEKFDEFGV
jgi:hypothetical protein